MACEGVEDGLCIQFVGLVCCGESRKDPARVSTLLGLTPSEDRVSALLAEGQRVGEIATAKGLLENCVRWLFQQVYKKTGVAGQVASVRQVLAVGALPRG